MLAKQALENKLQLGQELTVLENLHEQSKQNVTDLQTRLREMKADYHELIIRRDSLKARALSARLPRRFEKPSRPSVAVVIVGSLSSVDVLVRRWNNL